ncbi:MAG: DUF2332 family protein [Alphaproteobacteria bacterium]|nr:DUF2332 family protein [Alphaproteobacteria bacterium]
MNRATEIESGFRLQAHYCRALNAPFTAEVIEASADDYAAGGVCAELLADWRCDVIASALPLRIAGAFQFLARDGSDAALAEVYRNIEKGWTRDWLRPLLMPAAHANRQVMERFITHAVQTNEVRRTAALLGGFVEAAKATSLPLDLYEIGASAGLLLNWDRYAFDFGDWRWGNGSLVIESEWKGAIPIWPERVDVSARRGCDIAPIDYTDEEAVARAASYIWAEQGGRRERFLKAVAIAREFRPTVEKADAGAWLERQLAARREGRCAVIYQSVMGQYLADEAREHVNAAIALASQRASAARPLMWLRFEPDPGGGDILRFAVDLTTWPGGEEKRLAYAHPHGEWIEWLTA